MEAAGSAFETLIFVDIDGVLNIGIHDGASPIMFNEQNCELAGKYRAGGSTSIQVQKMLSVMERPSGSNEAAGATLRSLACRGSELCSDPLVARLAAIISAATVATDAADAGAGAGAGRLRVVLASNWRKPKYVEKVRGLEQLLSRHLNRPFTFDDTTRDGEEKVAADRLGCIGDYVQGRCREAWAAEEKCGAAEGGQSAPSELRVLVLDDFFITPMNGWECEGTTIRSVNDAEAYLRGCAPSSAKVSVRILHPYQEWKSQGGIKVQVAHGLTQQHCRQAAAFLSGGAAVAATATPQQQHRRCAGGLEDLRCGVACDIPSEARLSPLPLPEPLPPPYLRPL